MNKLIPRRRYSNKFKCVYKIAGVCDCIVCFSFQVDLHITSDCHVTYKGMLMRTVQGEITVKTMTSGSIK